MEIPAAPRASSHANFLSPPRFRAARFVLWFAAALIVATLLAWGATRVSGSFAPLLVFPALVGAVLGGVLVLLLRTLEVAHRPSLLVGTMGAGMVLVFGQHYFSYRMAAAVEQKPSVAAALAANAFPEVEERLASQGSFLTFLRDSARRGAPGWGMTVGAWGVAALWIVNAGISLAVATGIVAQAMAHPYCDRCGSWYRVYRSGLLDAQRAAAVVKAAAEMDCGSLGADVSHGEGTATYRLSTCQSGCGLTGCELSWSTARGPRHHVWLDPRALAAVLAALAGQETVTENATVVRS